MAKLIRITAVPEGEAPRWVREGWIGAVLPVTEGIPEAELQPQGVLTGAPVIEPEGPSFMVSIPDALTALVEHSPAVHDWWLSWWKHHPIQGWLVFYPKECEIISQ